MRSLSGALVVAAGLAAFLWAAENIQGRYEPVALLLAGAATLGGLSGWAYSLRDRTR